MQSPAIAMASASTGATRTRRDIIRDLETARSSKKISYLTSTRDNLSVSMAMDAIRVMYDHLTTIASPTDKASKID